MSNTHPFNMAFLAPFTPILRPTFRSSRSSRAAPTACSKDTRNPQIRTPVSTAQREARLQLFRQLQQLQDGLQVAVTRQCFADAARLRDQIQSLRLVDDYCRTEKELSEAVIDQRFADAARLRDVLRMLEPPPTLSNPNAASASNENQLLANLKADSVHNSSQTDTNGISIRAESYYVPEQSLPKHNRFLFGYKINITNNSDEPCQLISRHWIISAVGIPDSDIRGFGVVGRQPVLMPGDSFEYTSACPISTPLKPGQIVLGSMKGKYTFCKGDTGGFKFDADVNSFFFKLPSSDFPHTPASEP